MIKVRYLQICVLSCWISGSHAFFELLHAVEYIYTVTSENDTLIEEILPIGKIEIFGGN